MRGGLAVLVPTRGRPERAAELVAAVMTTRTTDCFLVLVVDDDDPALGEYLDVPAPLLQLHPVAEGRGLVAALNRVAVKLAAGWDAVAFLGDDVRPRTVGWDERYLAELHAGNLFVYGNDLLAGEEIPTQIAMRSEVIHRLGYMAPPAFHHLCVDLVWRDWGRRLGRISYLPDVVMEHMHPAAGKAAMDEGYLRVNSPEINERDRSTYDQWHQENLPYELEKLRELL